MYSKVLVPLDGSRESEGVLALQEEALAPDGDVILLQVIHPIKTQVYGDYVMDGTEMEASLRFKADVYLNGVVHRLGGDPGRWRCEVVIAKSVPRAIVDEAYREHADLILMYTHDRKGLARLIKGSVASEVQRRAPINVKILSPRELASVT